MKPIVLGCMHACGADEDDIIQVPCAGRIDLSTLLWAFAHEATGVLILSCDPSECRHLKCGEEGCEASGAEVVARARRIIAQTGLSPKRIANRIVARGADIDAIRKGFSHELEQLGRWDRLELGPSLSHDTLSTSDCGDRVSTLYARIQACRGLLADEEVGKYRADAKGDLLWLGCGEVLAMARGERDVEAAVLRLWKIMGRDDTAVVKARCCGQPLLTAGDEETFATLVKSNLQIIERSGARRVITACCHCAETMRGYYQNLETELGTTVVDFVQWMTEEECSSVPAPPDPERMGANTVDLRCPRSVALTAPDNTNTSVASVARLLSSHTKVTRLRWSPDSGAREETGGDLRSATEKLFKQATDAEADALVVTCSHQANRIRVIMESGGWQRGTPIPVFDLPEAFTALLEVRTTADGARRGSS